MLTGQRMQPGRYAIDNSNRTCAANQICGNEKPGENEEEVANHLSRMPP
jgi:hypothetical protein